MRKKAALLGLFALAIPWRAWAAPLTPAELDWASRDPEAFAAKLEAAAVGDGLSPESEKEIVPILRNARKVYQLIGTPNARAKAALGRWAVRSPSFRNLLIQGIGGSPSAAWDEPAEILGPLASTDREVAEAFRQALESVLHTNRAVPLSMFKGLSEALPHSRSPLSIYAALKEKLGDKLLITTDNNLLFVPLLGTGQLKEAARDDGADVVMVTRPLRGENANMFTVMIQVGRNVELNLDHVMSALRGAEARRRGIPTEQWATKDLWATGENKLFGGWYYHDSRRLIVCGTPKHELIEGEFTRLNPREVIEIVKTVLGQIFYKRH
jgi:hypothetical protein